LLSECENCGVENVAICPIEEERTSKHLVNWKHFSFQTILTKKGEEEKKLTIVYKSITFAELSNTSGHSLIVSTN
jgi:hypothetical protein